MTNGTVKWYNATKGYGFIEPENGEKDAFVHRSALEKAGINSLNDGQKVSYELVTGSNGKESADNIQLRDQSRRSATSSSLGAAERSLRKTASFHGSSRPSGGPGHCRAGETAGEREQMRQRTRSSAHASEQRGHERASEHPSRSR
jgi:CspA family cold shock protein